MALYIGTILLWLAAVEPHRRVHQAAGSGEDQHDRRARSA